jgi:hypothetical protein
MFAKQEAQQSKVGDATVNHLGIGPVGAAWWVQGKHVVLTLGVGPAEALVKQTTSKEKRLTSAPWFRKMQSFKRFETAARAHIDVAALLEVGYTAHPLVEKLVSGVGLNGLKSISFYSGFEDTAERGLVEMELAAGPRKGVLSLLGGKALKMSDVPALPRDTTYWVLFNFDLKKIYDESLEALDNVGGMLAPDQVKVIKDVLRRADAEVGIDIRKDLLDALGEEMLVYNSPSEGLLQFGQTLLFKVKDAKKLEASLAQLWKSAARLSGTDISVRKRNYRGVDIHEVYVRQQGFFYVPSYAIHEGWLAFAYYPQPIQGFVLRSRGDAPVWKPDPQTAATVAKLPKEFTALGYTDPRPTVELILSIAPIVAGFANSFLPDLKLEVGMLPNAHEATKHLFPNISISYMEGKIWRMETWASLALLGG